MSTTGANPKDTNLIPQYIFNRSFDESFGVLAVEMVGYDPGSNVLRRIAVSPSGSLVSGATSTDEKLIDYDVRTDGSPVYVGTAAQGTAQGSSSWTIKKYAYDASGNPTSALTSSGTWTGRASLTYT